MATPAGWAPFLAVAVVAGGVGGVVGRLVAPAAPAPRQVAIAAEPANDEKNDVADRIETLERHVRSLEHQQVRTQAANTTARAGADDAPPAHPAPSDPVFQAAVRDAMEQINDERRTSRQERSTQRLAAKLGLSEAQKATVATIAQELWQGMRDLRDSDNGDPTGDKAQELRAKSEARLNETLDPSQRAKYEALDDNEKISGRRGLF